MRLNYKVFLREAFLAQEMNGYKSSLFVKRNMKNKDCTKLYLSVIMKLFIHIHFDKERREGNDSEAGR